jgi:hypothetical protein
MIVNGSSNRCVGWWAQHLESEVNENVRIVESYGLQSENIHGMLEELTDLARGTRCRNPFYQINMNPAPGERLTEQDWDRARQIAEKVHALEGQPYFMVMHTKHGEEHPHFIYSRIDLENMRAIPDSHDARKNHTIAREIERNLGLQKVIGPYDREPETPRPERAPKRWEMYRGMTTGLDPRDITAEVTELFQQSDNGQAFKAALEEHGYELVTGQRGLLILDHAGKEHSLVRRIEGVNTKELNAFMLDVDRQALPTVEQARAAQQERKIVELEVDRATVKREIEWEEALAKSAIEKEKVEKRFIEPEARQQEAAPSQQQPQPQPAAPENLKGVAAEIRDAMQRSDNVQAFAAALQEKGLHLSAVTEQEARQSHISAAYPKAIGNFVPEYSAGQILVVTGRGQVYPLNRRTTGKNRDEIEAFLAPLDRDQLQGIEATKQQIVNEKHWSVYTPASPGSIEVSPRAHFHAAAYVVSQPEPAPEVPENLKGPAREIWQARHNSHNAETFAAELVDRGMTLARVTKDEARASEIDHAVARQQGRYEPVLREGQYVAVTEHGEVWTLNERTTGNKAKDLHKFMAKLDPSTVQSLGAVKQLVQARAEVREIERQAFRDLIGVGLLKRDSDVRLPKDQIGHEPSADPLTGVAAAAGGKALQTLANIAENAIQALGDMFGATEMTPERIQAAIEAQAQASEKAEDIDLARFREDSYYRHECEARARQKLEEEKRQYEQQRERDRDLER